MITPQFNLTDLQNLSADTTYYQSSISNATIRQKAVLQAAEALGMQAGLSQESQDIDQLLNAQGAQLDQIFNFNLVMYQSNVLPPVIQEDNDTLNISQNGDAIRIGGVRYKILSQVRFVTAPPTWRDYLWMSYPEPPMPDKSLLPTTDPERALWKEGLAQGWQEGQQQALSIYQINLNRLVQDFSGMILYKKLLVSNMVSPFFVSKQNLGVTGDGSQMTVDDQSMQITSMPQLQLKSSLWHSIPLKNNSSS